MTWKKLSVVVRRLQLVKLALKNQESLSQVCRRFGMSRKSGYKWLARFQREGLPGLRDRECRPHRSPRQISSEWVGRIRRLRRRYKSWGSRKLAARLGKEYRGQAVPCARTIGNWLRRLKLSRRARRRSPAGPQLRRGSLTVARRSNHVWTVDFKGWFRTGDDPRGQWQSLWIQRPGWADAIERVVDGLGNWSRIHHARTSGTERGARTDASCAQERNDATALAAPAGAATAHPSLGEGIQPNPSASGAWPTIARATVSAQSGADPQGGGELSKGVGSASCPDQRRSQVARQKAIPGRSLRRISGRDQNQRSGPMGGLFWKHPAWRVVGVGCGRGSSGALRPCELMPLHQLGSRTRGRGTNPRAASCPLLRSGSLRSPPLRSGQDAAFPSHL